MRRPDFLAGLSEAKRQAITGKPAEVPPRQRLLWLPGLVRVFCLLAVCLLAVGIPSVLTADESKPGAPRPATAEDLQFFESRVRPLLVQKCMQCHGDKQQKGGVRLDSRSALVDEGDIGPLVVPGQPGDSRLLEVVSYDDSIKMPPDGKLTDAEIAALTRWVEIGAPYPGGKPAGGPPRSAEAIDAVRQSHWAFRPVTSPTPPKVRQTDWPVTAIDRFVLAKLEEAGLAPSAVADRRVLLRRVTFDLTGLPPTPAELAAFEQDLSPNAWGTVIDRLLASPHYGERWGRYWLDVARYADTKGYVFFEEPTYPWAFTYRDYVIQAFNADLPYDQFIREQLAADLLNSDTQTAGQSGTVGKSATLAALGFLTVGGHFTNNVHDITDDRIDVVTRGLLGLTVTCARCHDHKFDPIPTADYYSLYGVFRSCYEPTVLPLLNLPPETPEYQAFEKELRAREARMNEFVDRKYRVLATTAKTRLAEYLLAANASRDKPSTEDFMLITGEHDINPAVLSRWWAYLDKTRKPVHPVWAPWHALTAIPEAEFAAQAPAAIARLAAEQGTASPINPLVLQALASPPVQSLKEVAQRYSQLLNRIDQQWDRRVKLAIGARHPVPESLEDPAEEQLRLVLSDPESPSNIPRVMGWGFLTLLPDRASQGVLQKLLKDVEAWLMTGPGAPPRAMVLLDNATPFEPQVFVRGNPNRPGATIPRQSLTILNKTRQPFNSGSGRLELARQIASPDNPLTARVLVNRVWMHHFGEGLVRTPGDFGLRSESPTHPQLLDYLASRFMSEGWSIKKLHREILRSAVYRQASAARAECVAVDPENRLLWRMNRRRLDFEAMRDAVLAVAGTLEETVGGPSFDPNSASPRRSVYARIDRMNLPEFLRSFDFPSPDATSAQRNTTTVAPQSLYLMNNPAMIAAAQKTLQRPDLVSRTTVAEKVSLLYELAFGRLPDETERRRAAEFLTEQPTAERWAAFVQALMMSNEFVFLD